MDASEGNLPVTSVTPLIARDDPADHYLDFLCLSYPAEVLLASRVCVYVLLILPPLTFRCLRQVCSSPNG